MRIGLTGGIASGKTMVSSRLAELGAAVLDADVFSRTAVEKGSEGLKEIVKAFGGVVGFCLLMSSSPSASFANRFSGFCQGWRHTLSYPSAQF